MSSSGTNTSNAGSSSQSKRKNAPGIRQDPGWEYGIDVFGNGQKVRCKYCDKEVSGIARFKHHLAGTKKDAGACVSVPDEVRVKMLELLSANAEGKVAKARKLHDLSSSQDGDGSNALNQDSVHSNVDSSFKRNMASGNCTNKQTTISAILKKDLRQKACKTISQWFYENAIAFNASRSSKYNQMWEDVARHGPGFKGPSYHELRETFLKDEMKEVECKLEIFKDEWKAVGYTIMSDGWNDKKRRVLCNFLVNSPRGTVFLEVVDTSDFSKTAVKVFEMLDRVVEKVEEENVVQVVTDNALAYKAAGALLMEKRKHLFWTPCAAHCIDLMLEDFEKQVKVQKTIIVKGRKITNFIYVRSILIAMMKEFTQNKDLVRAAVTRFATSYLTLGSFCENKGNLMAMFSSEKWRKSNFAKMQEEKRVQGIVLDGRFWQDVTNCLRAAQPLIKVLRLVDSDAQQAMPFLYYELTRAKEKIKENFNNVESRYKAVLKIIDKRWEDQMSRPLHYAAFWLNPRIHHSKGFNQNDPKVKGALYECVGRLVKSEEERFRIIEQLPKFHLAKGMFDNFGAMTLKDRQHPADWWSSFGDEVPELQKFAIRVLSLTCSASGCECNWSAFERIHTKKRNKFQAQKMNDLIYVMCNNKLVGNVKQARSLDIEFEDIDSDNEWTCGSDDEEVGEEPQAENLEVGDEDGGREDGDNDNVASVREDGDNDSGRVDGSDDGGDEDLDANVDVDALM